MEYMFDFSKAGEKKLYSWANAKKKEIDDLIKNPEEKSALINLVDENIKIYEKERIYQANLVLKMVKEHNYSPKDAYAIIKKAKLEELDKMSCLDDPSIQNKNSISQN